MKIRRVVTGHNKEGKSIVKWDSEIEAIPGRPGFSHAPMWATKQLPADLTEEDPCTMGDRYVHCRGIGLSDRSVRTRGCEAMSPDGSS